MEQETQLSMQALQSAELAPIVAQVIANPHIDFLDWHVQAVSVGAGSQGAGGLGLFRLLGSATANGQVYPWSMIVKVFSGSKSAGDPTGTNQVPSAWNYWKREILAYRIQCAFFQHLPPVGIGFVNVQLLLRPRQPIGATPGNGDDLGPTRCSQLGDQCCPRIPAYADDADSQCLS
jgi:hypothetical protein